MIGKGHFKRSSVPMHSRSVISMLEKFVPSPYIISKCVILDSFSQCIFVGNVQSGLGIFKKALPNHLLCLFDIASIFIKHKIIFLSIRYSQSNTFPEQPNPWKFVHWWWKYFLKDNMLPIQRSPWAFLSLFSPHVIDNSNWVVPSSPSDYAIP